MVKNHNIYKANFDSGYDEDGAKCVVLISDDHSLHAGEPVKLQTHSLWKNQTKALMDSSSVYTNIHMSLANTITKGDQYRYWLPAPPVPDLKDFSNELSKV